MLEMQDLIKVYPGPVPAVRGVTLVLERGLFGLLGPNGAGKSTLMKVLATLLEPTAGTFTFDGVDGVQRPLEVRRRLGYLPQDFGFYPNLSAKAMLAYVAALKGIKAWGRGRLVKELLERVNLASVARRKVGSFSGGMRQRLGIAQALIGGPALIIVDEPTAGLDPQERVRFYNLLGELAQDRVVILSTHIVEDVRVLCRRFAILRDGRIVYEGTPSELLARMKDRVYEGFLPRERLDAVKENLPIASAVVSGEAGAYRVRLVLDPGQVAPAGFARVDATLEDGYFATGLRGTSVAAIAGAA